MTMNSHFVSKSLIIFCLAVVGLNLKLDQIDGNGYDEDSMSQFISILKELKTEFIKMNDERIASFSKGIQQAHVDDAGMFSYPPTCNVTNPVFNYSYCFHGYINQSNETDETTTDARIDLFDLDDPRDFAVIGLKAVYNGEVHSDLTVDAGGDAEVASFGNKKYAPLAVLVKTYNEELSEPEGLGSSGLGALAKDYFFAVPHFKVYAFGRNVLDFDVERGPNAQGYVFAGKPYNLGFNISEYVTRPAPYGITVGVALDMSLTTVKNNISDWMLEGKARVVTV
ncbi:hypothetical protein FOL47_001506 [Perkinsus chesapeaki]|uniref:Uncharacterized protein n=1 Tax=Perkinsus chesapeaki TaxID=330153 RepID=A0A7J6KU64_PERCH|nr:hypothetical protein FOL47_001506 [Perkinsus chesapeaki]